MSSLLTIIFFSILLPYLPTSWSKLNWISLHIFLLDKPWIRSVSIDHATPPPPPVLTNTRKLTLPNLFFTGKLGCPKGNRRRIGRDRVCVGFTETGYDDGLEWIGSGRRFWGWLGRVMTVYDDWEWTGFDGFGQVRTGYDGSKGRWDGRLNTKGRVETD